MGTRRTFIKGTLATCALPVISSTLAVPAIAEDVGQCGTILNRFIGDGRFKDSARFTQALERHGHQVDVFEWDVTSLWYNQLSKDWQKQPLPIGGVTGRDTFFILSSLARDVGMRVALRIEHEDNREGGVIHSIEGDNDLVNSLGPRLAASDWPEQVADVFRTFSEPTWNCEMQRHSGGAARLADSVGVPLVSWVLAPKPITRQIVGV